MPFEVPKDIINTTAITSGKLSSYLSVTDKPFGINISNKKGGIAVNITDILLNNNLNIF